MSIYRSLWALAVVSLCTLPIIPRAEDIDLFVGMPPATAADLPNVLLIVDNTANWNKVFSNEMAALNSAVEKLPASPAKFRLGMMMFTERDPGDAGTDGAYVRAAIRTLDIDYKNKFLDLVTALNDDDKGNGGNAGLSMAEAYRYFSGKAPHGGNNKNKADYNGNVYDDGDKKNIEINAANKAIWNLDYNALNSRSATSYNSPILPNSCAKNFIIYISNSAPNDNASETKEASDMLNAAASAISITGAATPIPLFPNGSQVNVADEWARFMKRSPENIVTYTLDVDKVTTGQGPGWTALLKSMASVSSGKYFDVSSTTNAGEEIRKALETIFSEIQSVNSAFAAVSLPASVNTQGTYLNQVYVGMFRPDMDGMPRWNGNLKQYRLQMFGSNLKLADADGEGAINPSTGFITECARSFWTPVATDTYWATRPNGACLAVANSDVSNSPDGNIVEKGGQGYMLRSTTSRTVKTCASTASCSALVDFSTTSVSKTALDPDTSSMSDALHANMINWAKGQDVKDNENGNDATVLDMRMSAHGDVVHSRPVAINYGTDTTPNVVVFYGGNDGMLRAINGNRIGTSAGSELWSFMPPEFFPKIKRIYDNNVSIAFPGSIVTSPTPKPKHYGMDGPMAAYREGSEARLYATMRRGGRAVYAFNIDSASSPSLLWRVGPEITDFSNLGQTWSTPQIIKTASSTTDKLLIMGGGYDPVCEDQDPTPATCTSPIGNRVYVLNAETGEKLAELTTDRSVIGEVFVLKDSAGNATYAYAADTGGNVYRISGADAGAKFLATAPGSWTITKIASVGCNTVTTCSPSRKFQYSPDVVVKPDGTHVVLLGSGDREKPLVSYTGATSVNNHFFMINDKPTESNWLSGESANCGSNIICKNSLHEISLSAATTAAQTAAKPKGCYLPLSASEQVVTSSVTVFGRTNFNTHTPAVYAPGVCTPNLGVAKVYDINYDCSVGDTPSERSSEVSGGGLAPSPVAGMVILDDGTMTPFIIGGSTDSALESKQPQPPTPPLLAPKHIYWMLQK